MANKLNRLSHVAYDKARSASDTEAGRSFDQAVESIKNVTTAWDKVLKSLNQGLQSTPAHHDHFKTWWASMIQHAEQSKSQNAALAARYIANKIAIVAIVAYDKARKVVTASEVDWHLDDAITRTVEMTSHWDEILEYFKESMATLPKDRHDLRAWWRTAIEHIHVRYMAELSDPEHQRIVDEAVARIDMMVKDWNEILVALRKRLRAGDDNNKNSSLANWCMIDKRHETSSK